MQGIRNGNGPDQKMSKSMFSHKKEIPMIDLSDEKGKIKMENHIKRKIKNTLYEWMGDLSIDEITSNQELIKQIQLTLETLEQATA
jgi:hypothetical protein